MFACIIEYFYILVGKNKNEILTGDKQNGMSHGPVQIILTNQDKFSDEASSLWKVIRGHLTDNGEMLFICLFVMYINICIQALVKICNS